MGDLFDKLSDRFRTLVSETFSGFPRARGFFE